MLAQVAVVVSRPALTRSEVRGPRSRRGPRSEVRGPGRDVRGLRSHRVRRNHLVAKSAVHGPISRDKVRGPRWVAAVSWLHVISMFEMLFVKSPSRTLRELIRAAYWVCIHPHITLHSPMLPARNFFTASPYPTSDVR